MQGVGYYNFSPFHSNKNVLNVIIKSGRRNEGIVMNGYTAFLFTSFYEFSKSLIVSAKQGLTLKFELLKMIY